jgi:predicted DNA-binding transcriptional regulator AlpA
VKRDEILRLPQVVGLVGLSRVTLYRGVKDGAFPAPVALGKSASGW